MNTIASLLKRIDALLVQAERKQQQPAPVQIITRWGNDPIDPDPDPDAIVIHTVWTSTRIEDENEY